MTNRVKRSAKLVAQWAAKVACQNLVLIGMRRFKRHRKDAENKIKNAVVERSLLSRVGHGARGTGDLAEFIFHM